MLIKKVALNRQIASSHPITETLKKKISGSIDGEASQKDITGASGTPPISSEAITGITPHEQNGLKAPIMVANTMAVTGFLFSALLIYFEAPETLTKTATGMVITRYGQI